MALLWGDEKAVPARRQVAPSGEWRDGVFVPPSDQRSRDGRGSFLHERVRAVLDLRLE